MRAASAGVRVAPETASSRATRAHVWRRSVNRSFSFYRPVEPCRGGPRAGARGSGCGAADQRGAPAGTDGAGAGAASGAGRRRSSRPSPRLPPQQVVNLTMDEAVKMALDQNIEISVQRLNPQIQDFAIASAQAAYRPTVSSTIGQPEPEDARDLPDLGRPGGRYRPRSPTTEGLSQAMRWTGGSLNVNFNNSRGDTNSNNTLLNPSYNASLQLSYSQPLLRNRAIDSNRQSLLTSEISRRLADVSLRTVTTNTVANMRECVLGSGVHHPVVGCDAGVAGAGREARRGQPGARGSRHHGPD